MIFIRHKFIKRSWAVFTNAASGISANLFSLIAAFIVIRFNSSALWGTFVPLAFTQGIAIHIIGWGNKEYLIRSFSREPSQMQKSWIKNSLARAPLLVIAVGLIFLIKHPIQQLFMLSLWIIVRYISQSFEAIILFEKKFQLSAIIDYSIYSGMALCIWFMRNNLSVDVLLYIIVLGETLRTSLLSIAFRKYIFPIREVPLKVDLNILKASFIFFLFSLIGFLYSRVDLIFVMSKLPATDISMYQLFTSLLLYIQAGSYFIFSPFEKHFYRINATIEYKTIRQFVFIGFIICLIAPGLIWVLLTYIYHLNIKLHFLLPAFFILFPIYFYLPYSIRFLRNEQQKNYLFLMLFALLCYALLSFTLTTLFGLIGALWAAAVGQIIILGISLLYKKYIFKYA